MTAAADRPVFRFAPSPNGQLHLGHALSAFENQHWAEKTGGRLLLRIEDIDRTRCTTALEAGLIADLDWLGIAYERPFRRQSEHFDDYRRALDRLIGMGLAYPAFLTRGEVRSIVEAHETGGTCWPRDPDGAPHYPDGERHLDAAARARRAAEGTRHAIRLDMEKALKHINAPLYWTAFDEGGTHRIEARPEDWGDIVLSRSDAPSSYHLSVVVDDALQRVTHVVRGKDLELATAVHRLLQELLGLPAPLYHHHRLIRGEDGRKLSKSHHDTALGALRDTGASALDIRRLCGF
ncbi:tRNA glutamyl-Q(34) synthetase GluQRS [Martelella alba]|uniref:tRNA glutamyl-Q(34) synthetase GluQRS n=1 Tax=Martelella alba TaxID=2590451 RepID=A0A506UD54_9HYPH|nr:tRNA glutamyl-Q(34) synthetase GluQRS [Martelella alba]TPW31061.1 tRNA glutamyl-Q(34) synthetase GluQRS [Martelella alba]